MQRLRTLHLFAGAGGGILGDLLLGHHPVGAVELDPYCQQVLHARQQEGVLPWLPIFADVRQFDGNPWRGLVDIVCGGVPCQDISAAGAGAGLDDVLARPTRGTDSGSWPTPTATDYKGGTAAIRKDTGKVRLDLVRHVCKVRFGLTYPIPEHSEALMGWPIGWSDLKPLGTDRFRTAWLLPGKRFVEGLNDHP